MAEDGESAKKWVRSNSHKIDDSLSIHNFDFSARRMTYYPGGWDEDCLPYGTTDRTNLGEILAKDEVYQAKLKIEQNIA